MRQDRRDLARPGRSGRALAEHRTRLRTPGRQWARGCSTSRIQQLAPPCGCGASSGRRRGCRRSGGGAPAGGGSQWRPEDGDHESGADHAGQTEDDDVGAPDGQPIRWISPVRGHRRARRCAGKPAGDGDSGTECGQHRREAMACQSTMRRLGPAGTAGARRGRGHRSDQAQGEEGEGQRGHVSSVSGGARAANRPGRSPSWAGLEIPASARQGAAQRVGLSAPTRSTKWTSAACRMPLSAACSRASTIRPATSSSGRGRGVAVCAVVAVLHDQVLLGEALQNRHDVVW